MLQLKVIQGNDKAPSRPYRYVHMRLTDPKVANVYIIVYTSRRIVVINDCCDSNGRILLRPC